MDKWEGPVPFLALVNGVALGLAGQHVAQEADELFAGVARGGHAQDLTGGGVQRCKQPQRAVALVFEAIALGSARSQRQHPVPAIECLAGGLLVHLEHHGACGGLARMSTRRSPSAHGSTQRARRAIAALPLRLRITAPRSTRSLAVNVILRMSIHMKHTHQISTIQWTGRGRDAVQRPGAVSRGAMLCRATCSAEARPIVVWSDAHAPHEELTQTLLRCETDATGNGLER